MNHISRECCSLNCGLDLLVPKRAKMPLLCSMRNASRNYSRVTLQVLCVLPCLLKSYMNCYRKVPFRYLASLANSIALENSATYSMRCLVAEERPVVMMSRSMMPVLGSVADLSVAERTKVTARSTSSSLT